MTGRILIALAAIALAAGLFVVLQDGDDEGDSTAPTQPTTTGAQTTTTTPDGEAEPTATIEYRDGAVVGGPQEVEVSSGDEVQLVVASDVDAQVHVHGYDIAQEVAARDQLAVLFEADLEGAFELELHIHSGGEAELGELLVTP